MKYLVALTMIGVLVACVAYSNHPAHKLNGVLVNTKGNK